MNTTATLLLIENDATDAQAIQGMLADEPLDIKWVRCLSEGIKRLTEGNMVAVLLNLSLPDSQGIETFDKISTAAPTAPILVLGNADVEDLAIEALQRGAQDYLLKPHLTPCLGLCTT
jgi:DNA-binding response OmpR family regulator